MLSMTGFLLLFIPLGTDTVCAEKDIMNDVLRNSCFSIALTHADNSTSVEEGCRSTQITLQLRYQVLTFLASHSSPFIPLSVLTPHSSQQAVQTANARDPSMLLQCLSHREKLILNT